jgi:hypothetical protein
MAKHNHPLNPPKVVCRNYSPLVVRDQINTRQPTIFNVHRFQHPVDGVRHAPDGGTLNLTPMAEHPFDPGQNI